MTELFFPKVLRQLNRKTQVHPLTQHDGIHTRLTHSLEVSCIGRSLGMLAAEKIKDELPIWISLLPMLEPLSSGLFST